MLFTTGGNGGASVEDEEDEEELLLDDDEDTELTSPSFSRWCEGTIFAVALVCMRGGGADDEEVDDEDEDSELESDASSASFFALPRLNPRWNLRLSR